LRHHREAGYEDVNDAERLSQDRTIRPVGSEECLERAIVEWLTRPVGRASHKPVVRCKGFLK
jgi:hypothetical protein